MYLARIVSFAAMILCAASAPLPAQNPDYVLSLETIEPPGAPLSLRVLLDVLGQTAVQGWSYGVCHDPTALDLVSIEPGHTTLTVKNGQMVDFHETGIFPGGFTVGVVISFCCYVVHPGTLDAELDIGHYESQGLAGETMVEFCNTLGTPPVNTVIVSNGVSNIPTQENYTGPSYFPLTPFRRGDCNGDSAIDVADPVALLQHLFGGASGPACPDACDVDDGGDLSIGDAVSLLEHLFAEGPRPAEPYASAGIDPTPADGLGCNGDIDDPAPATGG